MQEIKVYNENNLPTIDYKKLIDFQGDLKELSDKNYNKLRKLLLKRGIRFSFKVWQNEDKTFMFDCHQRCKVLTKMEEEGFKIPEIPIESIYAETEKEARELLIEHDSRFGEITEQGLYKFLNDGGIDINDIKDDIEIPEIDIDDFNDNYYSDSPGAKTERETVQEKEVNISFYCPGCGDKLIYNTRKKTILIEKGVSGE